MKRLKVFVVDDDRDFAEGLALALELAGHEVESANSGTEAIEKFRQQDFDITFMDVRMPGLNGVESFLQIRKLKPGAKVMMMTAYSVEELLQRAIDSGAIGVLNKPFDSAELMKSLEGIKPAGLILIADDDPEFAESVEQCLQNAGHKVVVARSGEQALEFATSRQFDVLVLDLRLPLLSGLEVYLELQRRGRALPTILITGYANEEIASIDKLRELSVTGCLTKPFSPSELLQAIENAM